MNATRKVFFFAISTSIVAGIFACGGGGSSSGGNPPPPTSTAFYVAANGNDGNQGTLAAPFATFTRCRAAMETSSTIKTCYIRSGSYSPAPDLTAPHNDCIGNFNSVALSLGPLDSGQTWSYYPQDGIDSAVIDGGASSTTTGLGLFLCIDAANGYTSNITINGLQLQHFARIGILAVGPDVVDAVSNVTITNNEVHDIYNPATPDWPTYGGCGTFGGIQAWFFAQNVTISNNYVYNTLGTGISADHCSPDPGNLSGLTVANNVVLDTCTGWSSGTWLGTSVDCGGIYYQDANINDNNGYPWSSNITITNNFVRDVAIGGVGGVGAGIYLDQGSSNVSVTGNVITGNIVGFCFHDHGGDNNTITGNICDAGTVSGMHNVIYQTTSNAGPAITASAAGSGSTLTFSAAPVYTTGFYLADLTITGTNTGRIPSNCMVTSETATTVTTDCNVSSVQSGDLVRFVIPMTGNVISGNIFVNHASSVGVPGFYGEANATYPGSPYAVYGIFPPPTPQTSVANDYFTYGSVAPDDTGGGGANSDTNPQHVNPQLTGCYVITPGSSVLAAPLNFPPIKGGWGPSGFTIPTTGPTGSVRPSYPSPTC